MGVRVYPSGRLTEEDYEFLRDTHGLPQDLITELLSEPAKQSPGQPDTGSRSG